MTRRREALLWGVVGALAFLVALQGYELWSGERVAWLVKLGVAVVVFAGASGLVSLARGRLPGSESP
ncbi:MAG: hypothetical protein ABEJ89_03830 [Haloarculaceae archaeon]